MCRYKKIKIFLSFFVFSIIFIIIIKLQFFFISTNNFNNFDNKEGLAYEIIPNIIHYIIFGNETINFSTYLSIVSSLKFQKPLILYIHTDQLTLSGINWDRIVQINKTNSVISINYLHEPTHVFGQLLSSTYHATDLARIKILQQWGGIYLDTDVVILKNLDTFRHYEMVVGWPKNEYIGTQILLAHKNARFLSAWLAGYQQYKPRNWYYNAGQYPTEQILEKMPYLAHRVPDLFGVQNLQHELYEINNWSDWKQYYAIHLLSRHPPAPKYLNDTLINEMNNSFKYIARYILFT